MSESLPIDTLKSSVMDHWHQGGLIVSAPPGSGKTTRLPLWFLEESEAKIYLLIPKRIAVKLAAQQLSRNLKQTIGEQVGYQLRNDRKLSKKTQLIVTTYGTFLQMLINDPDQFTSSTIIFDEFHERSLDQDVSYALVNHLVDHLDDSIKRIFMSATMNSEAMAQQTGLAHLASEGRAFPVEVHYQKTDIKDTKAIARFIYSCWQDTEDHLLVFCPGMAEMRRIEQHIPDNTPRLLLHSQLNNTPDLDQLETADSQIILATNIAESSVTLARVHRVIDLGLERFARTHPVTGLTELKTRRISRASATQRAGRAGRLQPGIAWRLWSEDEHQALPPYQAPEIQQAELTQAALQCLAWGASADELNWLDAPTPRRWQSGLDKLLGWQAVTLDGSLTSHGQAMLQMGVEPWLAHLLSLAQQDQVLASAAVFAAHLSLSRELQYDPFVGVRTAQLSNDIRSEASGLCQRLGQRLTDDIAPLSQAFLIKAIPERLIRWQTEQNGQYFSGTATWRTKADEPGWALLLSGQRQGKQIVAQQVLTITESAVFSALKPVDKVLFQPGERAEFIRNRYIGRILLLSEPVTPDTAERETAWKQYIQTAGMAAFPWSDQSSALRTRWLVAQKLEARFPRWPCENELASMASDFFAGLKKLATLDTYAMLKARLGYNWTQWLDENLPEFWQAPSGRHIAIDYDVDNQKASVGLKLQEAFGLQRQPLIAAKQPLTLNLQAPNGRPVASVTDISYFWPNVYPDVRKELRGRYAKHPWPEDPINTMATMKTNRQLRSE
ncbi:MAG: ATP-dependent helicase C-terminal domain-containing protein [Reinekea sp.]